MAILYATITGNFTVPDNVDIGLRATIEAWPLTENATLTWTAENVTTIGPVKAVTDPDGDFSMEIPLDPDQDTGPGSLYWRFIYRPLDRIPGLDSSIDMGVREITADALFASIPDPGSTVLSTDLYASISALVASAVAVGTTNDGVIAGRINDSASATRAAGAKVYVETVSPIAYSAAGDDSADDTSELQSAITAAASFGLAVDLRGLTYKTTDQLDLPTGTVLTNGTIHCTGTAKKILNVTGSNVTLRNVSVIGRHATATAAASEYGIYAAGSSAASMITGLLIEQCSVELVGMYGIHLQFVDGFRVLKCDLGDLGYTGVGTLSAKNGLIEGCRIEDVLASPTFSSDGYGIHTSRSAEITSLTTSPRSENITIRNCIVSNVPWEGIDTHGGERITVEGNYVLGCKTGIAMVGADKESNVTFYAPRQIVVKGNVIDSLVTDGSAGMGITVAGAQGATVTDPAVEYATAVVQGNTIRGHGTQSDNLTGAILLRNTKGVIVSGNQIEQPSPFGIVLYYDNRGVNISGNTVVDAWSTSVTIPAAVTSRSNNNTGNMSANGLFAGSKSATYVNIHGLYNSGTGTALNAGLNNYTAAATSAVSSSTGVTATFSSPIIGQVSSTGGAADPGLSFSGDSDTGFYNLTTNSIGVTAGGTLRLRFDTSGILMAAGTKVSSAASATGGAGLIVPHGAAPTSPVNGDMWTTTAGLFVRINGVTKTVTLT